jgi:phage tail sheath gpL-like
LAVGQQLAAGSATSGELQEQIGNDNSENTLFGERSMLAAMIRNFKGTLSAPLNRETRIDAIGLDDAGAGVKATGNVTFTGGPATAAGSIQVDIGSERNHRYEVTYASGDSITDIGDALDTLVAADTKRQASSVNTVGDVEFTAEHAGIVGNGIGIRVTGTIPGVTIAVTAMSGGATNPTLTTLFDVVADERYQTIIWPAAWDFTTVTDFLDPRFNINGKVLDGVAVTSRTETFAQLGTDLDAENSASLAVHCNKKVDDALYKGSSIFELDYAIAAQIAAVRALRLTDGANIARFVIGDAGLDNFGGVHLSSKPYFNTPFSLLPVIPTGKGFTSGDGSEIETLLTKGGFVLGNNIAGNSIISGEVATTYKTDAASNPDTSFKFLNSVDTGVAIREFFFNNIRATYAQTRLTDGDLIPRVPSANEDSVRAFLTGLYTLLTEPEFSLTRSGEANLNIFKNNLTVSLDLSAGSVSGEMETPIVVQFREASFVIKIRF